MKDQSIFIYALITILIASCGRWEKRERIIAPVWSDDNTEIAYILNKYDYREHHITTGGDVRDERYSIFFTNDEFSEHVEVSNSFEGNGEELYYMKQAGYIISGSLSDKYHLTDAVTGELIKTFSPKESRLCGDKLGSFQTINVIPSINGDRLAVFETRSNCTVDIAFWEQDNGEWREKDIFTVPGNDFDPPAWVNESNLLVSICEDFCSEKYYLIHSTEGADEININDDFYASCMFVPTSSSWINKSGEAVFIDIESRDLKIASIWEDEEFISSYEGFNEEYYQPGCDDFD